MTAVWPGNPYPRGATWDGEGVNFSLFSENATRVELCLFDTSGRHEVQRIELKEHTDQIWHCYLPEARPGLGQVAVPDLVGVFLEFDALDFVTPAGIEQAQFHPGRVFREQREVDAFAVPGRAARIRISRPDRRHCGDRSRTPKGGRINVRECGRPWVL